MFDIFFEFMVS